MPVSSGQIARSHGISPIVSSDSGGARRCTRKRVFWSARDYILRCWRKKLLIKALNCTFLMQRGIPRRELTVISSRHRSRGLVCALLSRITHADTPDDAQCGCIGVIKTAPSSRQRLRQRRLSRLRCRRTSLRRRRASPFLTRNSLLSQSRSYPACKAPFAPFVSLLVYRRCVFGAVHVSDSVAAMPRHLPKISRARNLFARSHVLARSAMLDSARSFSGHISAFKNSTCRQ